jgi:hypothetical protein
LTLVGFSPTSQIIDPKSGYLTRDGFMLVQFIVNSVNGAGAVLTSDGIQTLTNKTISGARNTLEAIPSSALAEPTGDGDQVVTAASPGTTNYLALWSNGDLTDGPVAADVVTTSVGDERYVSMDGSTITSGPINLASYTVATVPTATDYTGSIIYVSDEAGGATPAFSNGTNWLRTADRAVIS